MSSACIAWAGVLLSTLAVPVLARPVRAEGRQASARSQDSRAEGWKASARSDGSRAEGRQASAQMAALLAQSRQLIRVETEAWDAAQGTLQLFTRAHEHAPWQPTGPALVAWIGRNGSAWRSDRADPKEAALLGPRKREGDGRSPVGLFALGDLWGYGAAPPPGVTLPYHSIDDRDRCVDDVASADYNQLRRAPAGAGTEPWQSAERLRMATDHYKLLLPIDYNGLLSPPASSPRPRRGAGSCIFLHIAPPPGTGTAGCTALSEPDLRRVLALLDPSQHPLFLLLPRPACAQARAVWQLPDELISPRPAIPDPAPQR